MGTMIAIWLVHVLLIGGGLASVVYGLLGGDIWRVVFGVLSLGLWWCLVMIRKEL